MVAISILVTGYIIWTENNTALLPIIVIVDIKWPICRWRTGEIPSLSVTGPCQRDSDSGCIHFRPHRNRPGKLLFKIICWHILGRPHHAIMFCLPRSIKGINCTICPIYPVYKAKSCFLHGRVQKPPPMPNTVNIRAVAILHPTHDNKTVQFPWSAAAPCNVRRTCATLS